MIIFFPIPSFVHSSDMQAGHSAVKGNEQKFINW